MPIDPFAVLNALLRAEAARSTEHEPKPPAAPPSHPAPARTTEPHRDGHDRS